MMLAGVRRHLRKWREEWEDADRVTRACKRITLVNTPGRDPAEPMHWRSGSKGEPTRSGGTIHLTGLLTIYGCEACGWFGKELIGAICPDCGADHSKALREAFKRAGMTPPLPLPKP